ncbi:hypothetical protein CSUI_010679 [Cystoisospora suis]|uniref:Transmembrane protein n=1 Tax=Cystoisospora suis TaxID=483139 RepID=A0A2C6KEE4_9APIC|nr:hypothetical protein CSUI_010679 [Cystoisospora suis]
MYVDTKVYFCSYERHREGSGCLTQEARGCFLLLPVRGLRLVVSMKTVFIVGGAEGLCLLSVWCTYTWRFSVGWGWVW